MVNPFDCNEVLDVEDCHEMAISRAEELDLLDEMTEDLLNEIEIGNLPKDFLKNNGHS